jgi:hypothetical protein
MLSGCTYQTTDGRSGILNGTATIINAEAMPHTGMPREALRQGILQKSLSHFPAGYPQGGGHFGPSERRQ